MFLALVSVSVSQTYSITEPTIARYNLNHNDVLSIIFPKSDIFIHVFPLLLGTLEIDATWTAARRGTFTAKGGDTLRFTGANLAIQYLRAAAPAQLTVWVLHIQTCDSLTIHSRYPTSATIHFEYADAPRCYFFQFQTIPRTSFVDNSSILWQLWQMNVSPLEPDRNLTVHTPVFLIQLNWAFVPFAMTFESDWADWSDTESQFALCEAGSGCRSPENSSDLFGLTIERDLPALIPILAGGLAVAAVVIAFVILFWSVGSGPFSRSAGMRPLANMSLLPIDYPALRLV
jgi:hypothetical protein